MESPPNTCCDQWLFAMHKVVPVWREAVSFAKHKLQAGPRDEKQIPQNWKRPVKRHGSYICSARAC